MLICYKTEGPLLTDPQCWVGSLILGDLVNHLVVTGTWLDYNFPETVGNITIIPTDEQLTMIFQRGRAQPPTGHCQFDVRI